MDCSLTGSSVRGISQARTLEWLPFPSPGDLPNQEPRDQAHVSCVGMQILYHWASWEALGKACCCCCCCWVASVVSDSVRSHRRQPTRLPRPWDSPGKNTGVGCHFLLQCRKVKSESQVTQSCPTLATPWTAAYQAPPSMGFSRQEYWSGVPLPSLEENRRVNKSRLGYGQHCKGKISKDIF